MLLVVMAVVPAPEVVVVIVVGVLVVGVVVKVVNVLGGDVMGADEVIETGVELEAKQYCLTEVIIC